MTYKDIPGWFDFEEVYRLAVHEAHDGANFVEVGSWLGKSTAFLVQDIVDSGKAISLSAVDIWAGSPGETSEQLAREMGGPDAVYYAFRQNLRKLDLLQLVTPLRMASIAAAAQFRDGGLDFVFLDGAHSQEAVSADLAAWWPKVAVGGMMGGHDHTKHWPGVCAAVDAFFLGEKIEVIGSSWLVRRVR